MSRNFDEKPTEPNRKPSTQQGAPTWIMIAAWFVGAAWSIGWALLKLVFQYLLIGISFFGFPALAVYTVVSSGGELGIALVLGIVVGCFWWPTWFILGSWVTPTTS